MKKAKDQTAWRDIIKQLGNETELKTMSRVKHKGCCQSKYPSVCMGSESNQN